MLMSPSTPHLWSATSEGSRRSLRHCFATAFLAYVRALSGRRRILRPERGLQRGARVRVGDAESSTMGLHQMTALWVIIGCGLLAIVYGAWAIQSVLAADAGSAKMQEISAAVREGAQAYLKRPYTRS